jgi:hypothetical protein
MIRMEPDHSARGKDSMLNEPGRSFLWETPLEIATTWHPERRSQKKISSGLVALDALNSV